MQHYRVRAHSAASPAAVYSLLLDGKSWPAWMGVDAVDIESTASTTEETAEVGRIGEIRVIRTGRYVNREQIVALVPNHKFSYIILDGMLHDYKGDVALSVMPAGGTDICWRGVFKMSFPLAGWCMQLYLTRFMQRAVEKLARYAERAENASLPIPADDATSQPS